MNAPDRFTTLKWKWEEWVGPPNDVDWRINWIASPRECHILTSQDEPNNLHMTYLSLSYLPSPNPITYGSKAKSLSLNASAVPVYM